MQPETLRCAIYTRKSSEEGLEQEFNSLHAQREACEAYALSQKHEGWKALANAYDDGGWSGGSMQRPGLQALLGDVRAGLVDVIIVYKVDRLTRSLMDFAKIVELLDAHKVSFVSVTQAFNTTTSMGRLTLNVLLSFAQFEREVTSERIRDKVAASKKKGMWMGGFVPLGYDWTERKLIVNAAEAERVKTLFTLYHDLKSADEVCTQAAKLGVTSKQRFRADGTPWGAGPICRGALYDILRNPIYIGMIGHKGERHAGQHGAIIDLELFEAVQAITAEQKVARRFGRRTAEPNLFTGILADGAGDKLGPAATAKGSRRYRYYVGQAKGEEPPVRYPAHELEAVVLAGLKAFLRKPEQLLAAIDTEGVESEDLVSRGEALAAELDGADGPLLQKCIQRIIASMTVAAEACSVRLRKASLIDGAPADSEIGISIPARIAKRAGQLRYLAEKPGAPSKMQDPALIRLLGQAQIWLEQLSAGGLSMRDLAISEGLSEVWIAQVVEFAFLAPDLKRMILQGRQPTVLTATRLKGLCPLPASWAEQRAIWASLH